MIRKISMLLSIIALSFLSVQAATVSGVVKETDSTGAVIANAIVSIAIGTQTLLDTTDAAGAYSITSTLLTVGTGRIRAAKTGYNTMAQSNLIIADSTATYTRDLYLVAIVYDSVTGTVTDSVAGTAVAGAKVLLRTGTGGGSTTIDSAVTGSDGKYTLDSVPTRASAYTLSVSMTGYTTKTASVTVANATPVVGDVKIVAIVYGSITGMVTDSVAGTAVAGAKVYLRTTGGAGTLLDSAITATDGSYTITHVQSGIARSLSAQATGFTTKTATVTVVGTAALTANFQLIAIIYGSITGTVTDSVAGTAVAGAKVYLRTTSGGGTVLDSAVTAANGTYTISNVQSGIARTLRAQDSGFVTKNTTVTVVGTAALTANIQLVAIVYGSITGTVTDSIAGTAVAGAKVYLRTTGGGGTLLDSAVTAADGSYTIAHVQSGIARSLSVQDSGFVTKTTTVTVVGTAALSVNIKLLKIVTGSITGTVKDSISGTAIAGAKVYLRTTTGGGTVLDSAVTAANGTYSIANVLGGTARTLRAQDSGFVTKNVTVTIVDTAALVVNFSLVKIVTGSITGTVTDSISGTAIAGAKVYLRTTGGGGTILDSTVTAANGTYTIANVLGGTARTLRVQDSGYVTMNITVTIVDTAALVVNVKLRTNTVSIFSRGAQRIPGNPEIGISTSGLLRLNNFIDAGMIKVFNASGKLLYQSMISSHTTFLVLPKSIAVSGNAVIVSVSQKNATYRKQIMMP